MGFWAARPTSPMGAGTAWVGRGLKSWAEQDKEHITTPRYRSKGRRGKGWSPREKVANVDPLNQMSSYSSGWELRSSKHRSQ